MTSPPTTADGWVDLLFDALAHPRRRTVLRGLFERRPMTLDELVAIVLERESTDESGSDEARVAASLRHAHLPKLRHAGLIEWTDDGRVVLDESVTSDDPIFELLERGGIFDPNYR